ncbi:hypothetical protein BC835DRAFT_1408332 [Cytidiella melzeri]|nr:hypothetical protein BC835DRAFT_1408332 [Cytidiella melzeri]
MVDDEEEQWQELLAPTPEYLASLKVFPLIPSLKKDVEANSPLSWEALTASDINFAIIRPLVFKYAKLENMAVVYACFVVRSHFLSEAEEKIPYSGIMYSRAHVCEILAMKLLHRFSTNQLQLAATLSASWNPLSGAPANIIDQVRHSVGDDNLQDPQCALEMAIATESKHFLSSPLVQTIVNDIYRGRVVFSMTSNRSVLADNYKPKPIEVYNVHHSPFLDHYRLRVPRYGAILEFLNFATLLALFLLAISTKDLDHLTLFEVVFIVFAAAFALEEYTASKEHGWDIYVVLRVKGLIYHDPDAAELAFDILACGACILFPRLAFFAVKNNVVVLALHAMTKEFIFFIGIAAICFSGLLYTLHSLGMDIAVACAEGSWSVKSIAWLMVQIWFGNTYLSFGQAESFHPVFGPILMTCFAALSNTLLLTILISILSNTFARIDANASQEYLFQFAISTIEGVKSDALFSYQPPFNLFAFVILWPLSFVLTPRSLHTTNVFLIKLTSFPFLVIIAIYERYLAKGRHLRESGKDAAHTFYASFSRKVKNVPFLERLVGSSATDLYDAIFDVELDQEYDLFHDHDSDGEGRHGRISSHVSRASSPTPAGRRRTSTPRRRTVSVPRTPTSAGGAVSRSPYSRNAALPALVEPSAAGEIQTVGPRSPLNRLFNYRREVSASQERLAPPNAATDRDMLKKLETMVDEIRHLPVNKLKEEMKELQERQARIENLLLMLTRGMRNETGTHSTVRHDTI